jgi:hypothetical protein
MSVGGHFWPASNDISVVGPTKGHIHLKDGPTDKNLTMNLPPVLTTPEADKSNRK